MLESVPRTNQCYAERLYSCSKETKLDPDRTSDWKQMWTLTASDWKQIWTLTGLQTHVLMTLNSELVIRVGTICMTSFLGLRGVLCTCHSGLLDYTYQPDWIAHIYAEYSWA